MKDADEVELHRLCDLLKCIHERATVSTDEQEALQKAALALHREFIAGNRARLEENFAMIGQPLLESERAHLRSLGIDPGDHQG